MSSPPLFAAENASAIAAAMVWVLRDGFGMIGSLLFSYAASSHMDSNIKEWRLFADIANDIGLTLDLVAPVFRGNFALVSSLATMCKVRESGKEGCTVEVIRAEMCFSSGGVVRGCPLPACEDTDEGTASAIERAIRCRNDDCSCDKINVHPDMYIFVSLQKCFDRKPLVCSP